MNPRSRNWLNISEERAARIRAEVKAEVRDEIVAELTPAIVDQIKEELWEKALKRAKMEVRNEMLAEAPTGRLKESFLEFVRETELDCHAQATVASNSADQLEAQSKWAKRFTAPLPWLTVLGALPALYVALQHFGSYLSLGFIMTVVAALVIFSGTLKLSWQHGNQEPEKLRKISSDYLVLAERAKSFRLVRAERMDSKARLDELTEQLRKSKVELDNQFHPRVDEVEAARESKRFRVADLVDPRRDFDERLAEAEAKAETPQQKAAR